MPMQKIKVLFFIYELGSGGAARTMLNIINNLDRDRFVPVLVTLNYEGSYEAELRGDVRLIKLETKRLRKALFPLARIIRTEQVQLVFSTHFPHLNVLAILANMISFSSAKSMIREADHFGGSWRANVRLYCIGLFYKCAQQVISLSEGVKENLIKRYKVQPERIQVIYNPVDVDHIQLKMAEGQVERQDESLFATHEKIVMTAGRLVAQKDHHTLLRAFAQVNSHLKSRLIVLGEGPLRESLEQEAEKLGIADRVHFVGFRNNPYVYFREADVFVLSSVHEGFSHVIAEALATGTPVVSTDCRSGPAEVLNHGEFGYLCQVGNAEDMAEKVRHVLTLEEEERTQLINAGYERARDFEAGQIVRQYEDVFQKTFKNT